MHNALTGHKLSVFFLLFLSSFSYSDNFNFNSYNNHGVVGLINMPTARVFDESVHGITFFNGDPDSKITLTANTFSWLEASFFYTSINNVPYCSVESDPVCNQSYKDKGFNFKIKIKEEGLLPAVAIGINDIAGSGFYGSEYLVGSYGMNNVDFHFGFGWGALNGSSKSFKNPLRLINDKFNDRTESFDEGYAFEGTGSLQMGRYFSGEISPFYGITYAANEKIILKIERDTTLTPGKVGYKKAKNEFSFGIEYSVNNNFIIGLSQERGDLISFKFIYKNDPKRSIKKYKYKPANYEKDEDKYTKLIKNLEENGIGVNKIIETSNSIGIELTQFIHPNIQTIEEIIKTSTYDAGIKKPIKTDLRIANLSAISEYNNDYVKNASLIYQRDKTSSFNSDTSLKIRPFIASREEFFKGALMLENDSEYIIQDNFFFSSNLKYALLDNFDDLNIPSRDVLPAQVRSDVKNYLRNYDSGVFIGRAQLDYHFSPKINNHIMITSGILEEMFQGYGFEYLYFNPFKNYAFGFEAFQVKKRDYEMRFGTLDYKNTIGSLNFYYKNYGLIPFDLKLSHGEYLAGDIGTTFEVSRSFQNGTQFGIFASFTDVSTEEFGEGSFDKGIFFNIPIYGNFIAYTWRPLTKDPGAKLNRKHTLYDLLVKFRPSNS